MKVINNRSTTVVVTHEELELIFYALNHRSLHIQDDIDTRKKTNSNVDHLIKMQRQVDNLMSEVYQAQKSIL